MIYVGIDPGKNGAIACYDTESDSYAIYDIPTVKVVVKKTKNKVKTTNLYDLKGMHRIFQKISSQAVLDGADAKQVFVVCELSMGMAFGATSVRGAYYDSPKTAFEKGRGYGILETLAYFFDIAINATVRPADWKRAMGLTNSNITYAQKKDASIELAKQLHPQLKNQLKRKKDDGRAEAVLIIDWAMKKFKLNG